MIQFSEGAPEEVVVVHIQIENDAASFFARHMPLLYRQHAGETVQVTYCFTGFVNK